jgi:hypothetical protein
MSLHDPTPAKRYRFTWIDKAGITMAVVVMVMFLALWSLLLVAVGSAPTERLSALCLLWAMKSLVEAVIPVWLIARITHAIAPRVVDVFRPSRKPISRINVVSGDRSRSIHSNVAIRLSALWASMLRWDHNLSRIPFWPNGHGY